MEGGICVHVSVSLINVNGSPARQPPSKMSAVFLCSVNSERIRRAQNSIVIRQLLNVTLDQDLRG